MPPNEDEDLDYWLATQALPKEEPAPEGSWQRAAKLLAAQQTQRAPDPMPTRPNGMSWSSALAAILSRDPGGVVAADAANRRAELEAWQKRQYAREGEGFERQMQLAQLLDRGDATAWTQKHTADRDAVSDQRWTAEEQRAREQFGATNQLQRDRMAQEALQARQQLGLGYSRLKQDQSQFDATQGEQWAMQAARLAAQKEMNDADNATTRARLDAAGAEDQRVAIPSTRVTDPAAYAQLARNPQTLRSMSEDVGTSLRVRGYLKRLEDIRGEKPSAANESEYNNIIKFLIGDQSKEGSTGVLSNTEFERYIKDLPSYNSEHSLTNKIGQVTSWRAARDVLSGRDPAKELLTQLQAAYGNAQRSKFAPLGFEIVDGSAPQPTPAVAPQPGAAQPQPDEDPLLKRYKGLRGVQ